MILNSTERFFYKIILRLPWAGNELGRILSKLRSEYLNEGQKIGIKQGFDIGYLEAKQSAYDEGYQVGHKAGSKFTSELGDESVAKKRTIYEEKIKEYEDLRKYLDESLVLNSDNKFKCTFICNKKTGSVHCCWKFNGKIANHYFDMPPAGSMYAAQAGSSSDYRRQIAQNMGILIGQSIGMNIMGDVEEAMRNATFQYERPACKLKKTDALLKEINT